MPRQNRKATRAPKGGDLPRVRAERVADHDSEEDDENYEHDSAEDTGEEDDEDNEEGDEEQTQRQRKKQPKRRRASRRKDAAAGGASPGCLGSGWNTLFLICWVVMVVLAVIGAMLFVADRSGAQDPWRTRVAGMVAANTTTKMMLEADALAVLSNKEASCAPAISVMRWLHFPKTGSSFIDAIYHTKCPAIPSEWTTYCTGPNSSCHIVSETVPFGSGHRPVIKGYQLGSPVRHPRSAS